MLIDDHIAQLKRKYDIQRSAQLLDFLKKILPVGCEADVVPGSGILQILCSTDEEVDNIWENHSEFLPYLTTERLVIKTKSGSSHYTATTRALVDAWKSYREASFMNSNLSLNLCNDSLVRQVAEDIYSCDIKPRSVVSLETHTNLFFNQALINLLGTTPQDIRTRDLRFYWLRREEMGPAKLLSSGNQLPPQLTDLINELRQCSLLQNRRYHGWLNDQYGIWTADIEAFDLHGEWVRKMTTHDFEPLL